MSDEKVISFTKKRKEIIEQKRRAFERLVFQNFLGAYTVIDQGEGIYPIKLIDISKTGCLFQTSWDSKRDRKITNGTELTLRMYFTQKSFIPVVLKIKYGKEFQENGMTYMRYGCEFETDIPSFAAMNSFIDFLYKFAEYSVVDQGTTKVYFL